MIRQRLMNHASLLQKLMVTLFGYMNMLRVRNWLKNSFRNLRMDFLPCSWSSIEFIFSWLRENFSQLIDDSCKLLFLLDIIDSIPIRCIWIHWLAFNLEWWRSKWARKIRANMKVYFGCFRRKIFGSFKDKTFNLLLSFPLLVSSLKFSET